MQERGGGMGVVSYDTFSSVSPLGLIRVESPRRSPVSTYERTGGGQLTADS